MDYRVIHVGTSLETRGGISAVLKVIFEDKDEKLTHIVTHCDGSLLKRIMTFMRGWICLICNLLSGAPAVYHVHSASYGSWMRKTICVLTIKLFRRPVILHMHGGEFRKFYETKVGPLGRAGIRMILRSVDAIIALSPEWAEFYLKLAPKTRVAVIANAVAIPPALSDARLLHVERWRIVCVGRLAERKGTFDLLRAIGPLGDTVELWLAGDGDLDLARSLAHELGISQRVELLGWIDADARASLLSGAHIFALPSHAEGLPMALLEAMSYGLPVISTPVGGIPSLVENEVNGILIGPRDVEALTTAIKQLTEDPKRASRLGAAARKTIEERYDASAFRAKLHELHAEVAEKYLEQGRAAPAPRATARERS